MACEPIADVPPIETTTDPRAEARRDRAARYGRVLADAIRDLGLINCNGKPDMAEAARRIARRTGEPMSPGQLYAICNGESVPSLPLAERIAIGLRFNPKRWFKG